MMCLQIEDDLFGYWVFVCKD